MPLACSSPEHPTRHHLEQLFMSQPADQPSRPVPPPNFPVNWEQPGDDPAELRGNRVIRDGKLLEVDGTAGVVRLVGDG
jgi:hypothetical protein